MKVEIPENILKLSALLNQGGTVSFYYKCLDVEESVVLEDWLKSLTRKDKPTKCPNTIDAFGDIPSIACPSCGDVQEDIDGFGFLHCDKCGYCEHPSMDDSSGEMRCGICGETKLEIEDAAQIN